MEGFVLRFRRIKPLDNIFLNLPTAINCSSWLLDNTPCIISGSWSCKPVEKTSVSSSSSLSNVFIVKFLLFANESFSQPVTTFSLLFSNFHCNIFSSSSNFFRFKCSSVFKRLNSRVRIVHFFGSSLETWEIRLRERYRG